MTEQEMKVTGSRIAVIIGKKGATKHEIEQRTGVSLHIDSKEGMVRIEGDDTIGVLNATEVVKAINRGFSPHRALCLLDEEDMMLDIIDLSGTVSTTKQMERIRGRIIGKDGRSREQIEDLTNTSISVFGKTVSIIGAPDQITTTRSAIDMLIRGVPHEVVYSFLDRKKKEAKREMFEYYY